MAIITEYFKTRSDGVKLYRTYSDLGFFIKQNETGVEYAEAVDIENCGYTYSEIPGTGEDISAEEALAELVEVLT